MDSARPIDSKQLLTLQQAAQRLGVSVDVLLKWNEYNILKPTITYSGQIGYREEQINQFIAIRQLTQQQNSNFQQIQTSLPKQEYHPAVNNTLQKDYVNFHARQDSSDLPIRNSKNFSIGPTLAVITLGIAVTVILITQPDKIKLLFDSANNMKAILTSQISKFNLSGSNTAALPVQLRNTIASDKNLKNEGAVITENNLTLNAEFSEKPTTTAAKNRPTIQTPAALLGQKGITNVQASGINGVASSYLPSHSDTNSNSVFDANGNIKGKTNTSILAAATQTTGVINNNPTQNANTNILLTFLGLGSLSLILLFKKRNPLTNSAPAVANQTQEQRILEVNQKTDGTVVLYFQGQEYKVCKPELDSESDQFIARLMEFAELNVKEIDYDNLQDPKIRLSAPLSKLVTRLGFVGLKRDLFFPRTSKNRVLFRRYITEQDLASMGLTAEQISGEFLSIIQS